MRRAVIVSAVSQGLISGLMFAISLALIVYATPAEFGGFVIATALLYLSLSVQGALVVTPISVLLPGVADGKKTEILSVLSTFAAVLSIGLSIISMAIAGGLGGGLDMCFAVAALVVTGLQRDLARGTAMALGEIRRYLLIDGIAVGTAAIAIVGLWQVLPQPLPAIVGLAIGNGIGVAVSGPQMHRRFDRIRRLGADYRQYWHLSRWALVGASAAEAQARIHVFAVEILRSTAAVGTVNAGRVIVSPVLLLAQAWGKAALPRLSERVRSGDEIGAIGVMRGGLFFVGAVAALYFIALWIAWPQIEARIFQGRYEGIETLVVAWCVHAALGAPLVCMSMLLQARRRFRDLAIVEIVFAVMTAVLLTSLVFDVSLAWAVICLIAGQIGLGLWMVKAIREPGKSRVMEQVA